MKKLYLPFKFQFLNFLIRIGSFFNPKSLKAAIAFLLIATSSYATHMAGGELTYKWLSGTKYVFTATFYRDCAGVNAPPTLVLNYQSATCGVNNNATLNPIPGTGQEITFPCPSAKTTCQGGTSPGFQEWVYSDTLDIKKQCTDWVFSFTACCRNTAITTINGAGSDNMYIEATLNNSSDPNASSPTFSNVPLVIACAGQTFNYNQGAIDPNGDSLVYSFICPRVEPTTCVTYNNPYSVANPIASTPPVSISSSTGSITMNPTTIQVGVITTLVQKYHNGVLVGSVLRDMEVLVVACTNTLPTATGINGTNVFADTVCAGSNFCFNILSNDADAGQSVTMTWNDGISDATFTITPNVYPLYPVGQFCWTPSLAEARANPYTFTVTVRDNACPTNGVQTYAYSILVPALSVSINTLNIACFGGTGSATATGSGGTSPYTYSWSPTAQTTATASGLNAGTTYTVAATDKHGCSATNTIVLTQPSAITASVSSSTNVSCNGGNNGSATVSASGGAGGFTHSWSNGQTTDPAVNLIAGTYTDTVKDANGCIKLVPVTISQPATLTSSITTQQNASCKGLANGQLTVTPAGGTRPYMYVWSPNVGTDSTVTGLIAGTYTVTVTDSNGCTTVQMATITQPGTLVPLITNLTITGGIISCYGATNGSLSVSVSGGTPAYTFLWSPGGYTTDTVSGLSAGTYTIHVVDDNGCSADTSITLSQPDSLIVNVTDLDLSSYAGGYNISCNGNSDGFIDSLYLISGGTPPYTYSWMPGGGATKDTSGLMAGTYTITVTDVNGCTASDTITLIQPPLMTSYISVHKNAGCQGDSSGVLMDSTSGGTGPYMYQWSNGATTQNLIGIPAGTYSVVITDMNGCSTTLYDTITQPGGLHPLINTLTVIGGLNVPCSGDTTGTAWVVVSGGTPPFSYSWFNGATTDTIVNLGAQDIFVTVMDSNGCSKIALDSITEPQPISAQFNLGTFLGGGNTSCSGSLDGSITLSTISGGTPGYTFSWSNGEMTANDTALSAGTYTVLITDTNGCKDSLSFVMTAPPPLTDTLLASATNGGWNISCNGGSDGTISTNVSGGTEPYSYVWVPNVSNTSYANNLGAGTYIITVTDTNGCSVTDSITLMQPPPLFDTLSGKVFTGGNNISCYGYSDGCISDSVSGGTLPYSFLWSSGDTTQSVCFLSAGTYFVTITDANGCTRTDSITLTQPDSISPNPIITQYSIYNIQCHGGIGCVQLTPTGGTPGYTYFWTPSEDSTSNFCDTAGTYNVLVTDSNGCFSNTSFTLTQPDSLVSAYATSNYGGSNVSCNSTCDGTITVTITGGVGPYTYSWSPNVSIDSVATGLCAGTYIITVTDSNGCSTNISSTLVAPPPFTDSVATSVYAGGYQVSCAGNDGTITIIPSGGTRPYHYSWSPNTLITDSTASGLIPGTYIIQVTDSNGCSVTDTVTLKQANPFTIVDTVSDYNGHALKCTPGDSSGYIHVTVTGGVPPFSYLWSNGATTQNLDSIPAGTYTDTITDSQGCRTFLTETLTAPNPFTGPTATSNYNGSQIKCNGDSTSGWIAVNATGGTAPYTYNWSNSQTTDSIYSLGAGTYSVIVTDANGCTATASDTLTAPTPLNLSAIDSSYNGSGNKCNGDSSGYIHVIVSGGTPVYTYTWNPSVSADSIASNLAAGTYTYTVTDKNGCTATGSQSLTAPTPLSVSATDSSYNGNGTKCNGDSTGYIHVIASGGTPVYTYTWNPSVSTDSIAQNLAAGTYTYTVTDKNGCTATGSQSLTAPRPLNVSATDSSYNGSGTKCNGDSTGYIHVIASGGTPVYTYTWNPSVSTDSIASNLAAGTYTYTVTDKNGCTATGSQSLTAPTPLSVSATDSSYNGSGTKCNGDSTGYIHVIASGGTPVYTYTWNPSVSTDSIASNLAAGTYTYTVTDKNGCTATGSQSLTAPMPLSVSTTDSSYNGNGTKCNGDSSGYIHVIATGGTPVYTYSWNPSVSTDSIAQNLTAGTYTYTVTDKNGCTATGSQTLTAPPVITVNAGSDVSVCADSAVINGSSPLPGYTGTWSFFSGSGTITNPNDSTTSVTNLTFNSTNILMWTVTDGFCRASDTVSVETFSLVASAAGNDASVCPDSAALIQLNATTVSLPAVAWWSPGVNVKDSTNANTTITTLVTGSNTFVWIVVNGACNSIDTVVINLKTDDQCFDSLMMPNGFTPNGDGHNDNFDIHGIEKYPNNNFSVFNRWGNEVYSYENYSTASEWHGQNKSGEPLPDGTYFAILVIKNTNIALHGYVDLRRTR